MNPNPSQSNKRALVILGVLGILVIVLLVGAGVLLAQVFSGGVELPAVATEPAVTFSTAQPDNSTLKKIQQAKVPTSQWVDIASRLQGKKNVPAAVTSLAPLLKIGDKQAFWILNNTTSQHLQEQASLQYISSHVYFWVQDGLTPSPESIKLMGDTFENKIYPTDRQLFGSEWTPGVDNDVHLYIVFTRGPSNHALAYFSSEDELNPLIDPFSNGHELFVVNASLHSQLDDAVLSYLAHEFQHMIEYNMHRTMEGWMNEGLAVLASFKNDYGTGGYDTSFIPHPDLQLNDFPNNEDAVVPHYGAAFLFLDYYLSRFGDASVTQLVKNPAGGLDDVDATLGQIGAKDAHTGQAVNADDLFADWTAANYLGDAVVGDGRYAYSNFPDAPKVQDTQTISSCPLDRQSGTVHQYGADYIHITCRGSYTLSFQGSTRVTVLPADPHSGSQYFWSNKGDESDMTLTHAFDFAAVSGPVSMTYWNWYDVEKNYDYVYLLASTDGQNWEMVKTSSGTTDNPGNNNLGIGYNGASGSWLKETVDLSKYAGQKVQLRFEYITDAEVFGEGYLLDDVSIPAIGYSTDFEADDGGWEASGFVRIQNMLPQTYRLSLIDLGSPKSVTTLDLTADQTTSVTLGLRNDVVLIVSGTTRYTRQLASYELTIK